MFLLFVLPSNEQSELQVHECYSVYYFVEMCSQLGDTVETEDVSIFEETSEDSSIFLLSTISIMQPEE